MQNVKSSRPVVFKRGSVLLLVLALFITSCQPRYTETIKDYFVSKLGDQYKDFSYNSLLMSAPTVGHIYFRDKNTSPGVIMPSKHSSTIPSYWLRSDVPETAANDFFNRVFYTSNGPSLVSDENAIRSVGFNLESPVKLAIAELGLSASQKENVKVQVNISKFVFKEILWGELLELKNLLRPSVRKLIDGELGDIVIVNKVVLIEGYNSTVKIDANLSTDALNMFDKLTKGPRFGLNWKKEHTGIYAASAYEPMVVAYQFSVPLPDPTRSSGQKLVPVALTNEEFLAFLNKN